MYEKIIIIGSGPGGSTIANSLVSSGMKVTLIEEGPNVDYKNISSESNSLASYYRYGGSIPILSKPIIPFAEGRVVGGGSVINGALLWRTPTKILLEWYRNKSISDELYELFNEIFVEIESELNVGRYNYINNLDSKLIVSAARELGWKCVKVPRAVNNCINHNRCAFVCKSGAKQSLDNVYIKDDLKNGLNLMSDTKVIKLNLKNGNCNSITIKDKNGDIKRIKTDLVILSCGPIQTPVLLKKSGFKSPNIGSNLMLHCNLRFVVLYDKKIESSKGTIFSHQVQEFEDKGILIMAANFSEGFLKTSIDKDLNYKEDEDEWFNNSAIYTTQFKPSGIGSVKSLFSNTICEFNFNKKDLIDIKFSIEQSVRLFFSAGAKKIILPLQNKITIENLNELKNILKPLKLDDIELTSVHAMSSCKMGDGANDPVNHQGYLKEAKNIIISDASILPSNIGESPQGTIMYFSKYIGRKLIQKNR